MSGLSKWSSIKHKKGAADAKRGKLFTKLARAITVAARDGGGNTDANPALGLAVQRARDASMPKDNIQRAIDRGTGEGADAAAIEAVTYEGYGPGGAAILPILDAIERPERTRRLAVVWPSKVGVARPGSPLAEALR